MMESISFCVCGGTPELETDSTRRRMLDQRRFVCPRCRLASSRWSASVPKARRIWNAFVESSVRQLSVA